MGKKIGIIIFICISAVFSIRAQSNNTLMGNIPSMSELELLKDIAVPAYSSLVDLGKFIKMV